MASQAAEKSHVFEGDGLQAVRKAQKIEAAFRPRHRSRAFAFLEEAGFWKWQGCAGSSGKNLWTPKWNCSAFPGVLCISAMKTLPHQGAGNRGQMAKNPHSGDAWRQNSIKSVGMPTEKPTLPHE
jgi:hypothetical protein